MNDKAKVWTFAIRHEDEGPWTVVHTRLTREQADNLLRCVNAPFAEIRKGGREVFKADAA